MSANDILEELRENYLHNFPAQLEDMENYVLQLEKNCDFKENFDALYRKVHSLKGSGGTYGFSIVSSICHQLEDFLTDEIEKDKNANQTKINTMFAYIDMLKDAYGLLCERKNNFTSIEKSLHKLKQQNSTSKLRVLIIGSLNNMYGQICSQILESKNIAFSATSTIPAIQRLMHERFDVLITSQENQTLNGTALIAAIKLNKKNRNMKSILITSNSKITVPKELAPEYVVIKDSKFPDKLSNAIENIISEA